MSLQAIELPRGRIEARFIARPGAPRTLVFLHEGLGCAAMWRGFPDAVAEATGSAALVYTRFGYGGSGPAALPRPLTYMHEEGREVLPALIQAAGIGRHVLIGHSDGASIALVYAGSAPRPGLDAIVCLAPHVLVEDISVRSIAAVRTQWETTDLRGRLARWHGGNTETAFRGWNEAWLDPAFRDWNIEEFLPAITVPVLVIQGEADEYGTALQVARIAGRAGGPVETLMLTECGHAPQRDQPVRTAAAITRFVAALV